MMRIELSELAWRNLVHDKVRLLVTVTGVVFAVVLIFVDVLYKQKLGVNRVGDVCEIRGHRARVAGFTRGIRSFTTSPYVFTSFKNAQNYVTLPSDQTIFILISGDGSVGLGELSRRL